MMILLIIGIVVLILGAVESVNKRSILGFLLASTGSCIITCAFLVMLGGSQPSAMDVYKGKTTLEITYRDGVPVDSVVVFKNKK